MVLFPKNIFLTLALSSHIAHLGRTLGKMRDHPKNPKGVDGTRKAVAKHFCMATKKNYLDVLLMSLEVKLCSRSTRLYTHSCIDQCLPHKYNPLRARPKLFSLSTHSWTFRLFTKPQTLEKPDLEFFFQGDTL